MGSDKVSLADPDSLAREKNEEATKIEKRLIYAIDEQPPWPLSFLLGFQQYLLMFGGTLGIPFLLGPSMCFESNPMIITELLGTLFFCSGLATLAQTTFGVRLPIVQGGAFSFITPTIIIMTQRSKTIPCYSPTVPTNVSGDISVFNSTTGVTFDTEKEALIRLRLMSGAIMVSSLFQMFIGFSGLLGYLLKVIGPLTIAPTLALLGLPLYGTAAYLSEPQWGVAALVALCIILFSQILKDIKLPLGCTKVEIFKLFPVLMAIVVGWILSAILTLTNVLKEGSRARTDYRGSVIQESAWFRFPYPGQWGAPTVDLTIVIGMVSGVIVSVVESIGDYYACARLSGAPSPPKHAMNRGIGFEGIGVFICGAWGATVGTTSFSQNIAAIGITKVGSVRVVQCGGLLMLALGLLGKAGAFFSTIPTPVVGGIYLIAFGLIAAVGISSLMYVDLSSMRNLFVLGVSFFLGFVIPSWVKQNGLQIDVGNSTANEVFRILLSINMLVGGFIACLLDNVLPASREERGISSWNSEADSSDPSQRVASIHVYDPPFLPKKIFHSKVCKYLPFMPYYADENLPADGEECRDQLLA